MRFRSLLMFACMIVVPMLAMFSHKLPPEFRDNCSRIVLDPAIELIASLARPADAEESDPDLDLAAPSAGPLLAAGGPPPSPGVAAPVPPASPITTAGPFQQPPEGQAVSWTRSPDLRRQLEATGAQRLLIESRGEGSDGVRGSCRLAVDAEGQLQRLFHASGASETEMLRDLLEQVGRWRRRIAANPPIAGQQLYRR